MAFSRRTQSPALASLTLGSALASAFLLAATALAQQPQASSSYVAPAPFGATAASGTFGASGASSASARPAAPVASPASSAYVAPATFGASSTPAAPAPARAPDAEGFFPFVPAASAAPAPAPAIAPVQQPAQPAAPGTQPLFPASQPMSFVPPPPPAAPALAPAAPPIQAPATSPGDSIDLRPANRIIAVVEDQPITVDDVRLEIAPLLPEIQRGSTSQQDFDNKLLALQDDIIQNHIDRALIVKDFYKEKEGEPKKSIPASFIDNQMSEDIINRFDNDRSKFLAYLRAKGQTIREYRKDLEEDMINGYMRSQQRKNASVVSPVKVQTFYDENKDKFYQDDQVHLRLIQFTRNGQTDDELRAQANEVINRLKNGEKFEDIAKEVSQDTRRSKGGDWGWQKRTDLKPELSAPLFNLKKGEVTAPILMPEGAFLMYVEDRKYAGIQPLDDVRDQIEQIILQQMARSSQEQWLERLRRDGYVKYYDN